MKVNISLLNKTLTLNSNSKGVYLPLGDSYLVVSNYGSTYFGLNYKHFKILDLNNIFPLKKVEIYENKVIIDNVKMEFRDNYLFISDFIPLLLDPRYLYDYNPFNRKYEFKDNTFYFNFGKIKLEGELKKIDKNELEILKGKGVISSYSFDGKFFWIERTYQFDLRRRDKSSWYVLYPFNFKGKIYFDFKFKDKKEELNNYLTKEIKEILEYNNKYFQLATLIVIRNLLDKQVGRPWFFQEWKRDFLISLEAFYLLDKGFIKNKLLEYFKLALNSNRRGKLFKEFHTDEFYLLLNRIAYFWDLFNEEERDFIIDNIKNFHFPTIIYNLKGDTWMDSISREGINIEIQFYAHYFYSFFEKYDEEFKYLRRSMEKELRNFIFNEFILDNLNSYEIRPNFLIAWYFNRELADKLKFKEYFINDFDQLLTDWFGITTISKCYPLHHKVHTGIDSKSYHNGDVWYFINNLTASLFLDLLKEDLNKDIANKIKEFVVKTINNSFEDIFNQLIFGGHSEISSAKRQESLGCFDQLWSNATFLVLTKKFVDYLKFKT